VGRPNHDLEVTMNRIATTSRRRLAIVGGTLALLAAAGTGVAAAGPSGPATKPGGATAPAAGTQALAGYTRVTSASISLPAGGFQSISVSCPAGQRVFGGGESNSVLGTVVLTDSWPSSTTSWLVYAKNNGASAATVTAYAICGS
jgi:hypothetical protein